jgi:prepilin-type N-terminal cleavage/methylation domain-containing protein
VIRDSKGMTLIEILIAFSILAITFTALIQSTLVAINTNVQIELREDAVAVADERMTEIRNMPFPVPPATNDLTDTGPGGAVDPAISKSVRSATFTFTPTRTVTTLTDNTKQVVLQIAWKYRGTNYQHTVSTVVRSK